MKKLFIIFIGIVLVGSLSAQLTNTFKYEIKSLGGITIGPTATPNKATITSTILDGNLIKVYDGATQRSMAIAPADQVDGSTLYAAKHPTITPKVDSYEINYASDDDGTIITMTNAGATNLTIPLNATDAFQVGTQITLICLGTGSTTIVATGGVTTVIGDGRTLVVTVKGIVTLVKIGTDTWYIAGDLVAS